MKYIKEIPFTRDTVTATLPETAKFVAAKIRNGHIKMYFEVTYTEAVQKDRRFKLVNGADCFGECENYITTLVKMGEVAHIVEIL